MALSGPSASDMALSGPSASEVALSGPSASGLALFSAERQCVHTFVRVQHAGIRAPESRTPVNKLPRRSSRWQSPR
eukprot:3282561-Alexandrium_andersonii.AAC.1